MSEDSREQAARDRRRAAQLRANESNLRKMAKAIPSRRRAIMEIVEDIKQNKAGKMSDKKLVSETKKRSRREPSDPYIDVLREPKQANLLKGIYNALTVIGNVVGGIVGLGYVARWAERHLGKYKDHGRGDYYGPGSSPGSHNPGRGLRDDSGFIGPVVLDLDRDGSLDLVSDAQGGWTGPTDGFLAIDADGSGAIDQANEIAFVEWDKNARTDLEGLALAFDSNDDGVFDANDERFADFSVWQDADGNRVSDPGELMSLDEAGITSIDVSAVPYDGEPKVIAEVSGNKIFGYTDVTYADGTTTMAGDVALKANDAALDADVARMTNSIASFGSDDGAIGCRDHHQRSMAASTPMIAGNN